MSFLAVLLALLLDQARPVDETHPVRRALRRWVDAVRRQLDAGDARSGWLAWGVAVLGPAGLAGLAYLLLAALHPALAFAWLVLVLYLTLGFRQFSHHFTALREALFAGDDSAARRVLSDWEGLETDPRSGRPQVLRRAIAHAVLAAHHHVFGVLAAFLVLGVLGLLGVSGVSASGVWGVLGVLSLLAGLLALLLSDRTHGNKHISGSVIFCKQCML